MELNTNNRVREPDRKQNTCTRLDCQQQIVCVWVCACACARACAVYMSISYTLLSPCRLQVSSHTQSTSSSSASSPVSPFSWNPAKLYSQRTQSRSRLNIKLRKNKKLNIHCVCVLPEPHAGFKIAFNMFDADGNQMVDKREFLVVSLWYCASDRIPHTHQGLSH